MAGHLVAAGTLVDEQPEEALAHARAARDRASRIAAVREAVGVAAYHAGEYAEAARELRAYRRMGGDPGYRAVLADCERAQGRPEVALRLVREALADSPEQEETVELRLVEAGARMDLGESAAARLVLEGALGGRPRIERLRLSDPGVLRLATAYADLLAAAGDRDADEWRATIDAVTAQDVEFGEEMFLPSPDSAVADTGAEAPGSALDLPGTSAAEIEAEVVELLGETDPAADGGQGSGPTAGDARTGEA